MEQQKIEAHINEILSRGVGEFIDPNDSFRKKLTAKASGEYKKPIIVKLGVDPTRPDIHLGHAVVLKKLRALQDIGCKVIFLIGDFTSLIGDPTGKSKTRPEIDGAIIETNLRTYLEQVGKILLVERNTQGEIIDSPFFSWIRNSDWFFGVTDVSVEGASEHALNIQDEQGREIRVPGSSFLAKAAVYDNTRMQKAYLQKQTTYSISLVNMLSILRQVSFAQLIERDMFQDRITKGEPLFMHEMLYPILQGADSNVLADIYGSCDMEIGGTDQVFNMLMGRKVMEVAKKEPQAVLAMKLLVGLDGKEKMSKSLDNYIAVNDNPSEMFGKIMSLPDSVMREYFELATYAPTERIKDLFTEIQKGKNPKDVKIELAKQIVATYHGEDVAQKTGEDFLSTFRDGGIPENIPHITVLEGTPLDRTMIDAGVVASRSEYRRLLDDGAISVAQGEKVVDPHALVITNTTYRIGKHRFLKVLVDGETKNH